MRAYGRSLSLIFLVILVGASLILAGAAKQGRHAAVNSPMGTVKPGDGTVRETLGNGLRVVIVPDDLAPVATGAKIGRAHV